jgi:putative nucleotidyltransferase with HDIG domain
MTPPSTVAAALLPATPAPAAEARGRRPWVPSPFPAVALQLVRQMQDPGVSAGDVARLIEFDPSLTAALLRLVNSPFFGMAHEIANVSDAVMVLGMGAVRRMVLSLAVLTPLREAGVDPEFVRTQWQHTVGCAAMARHLIDGDPADCELAFTAGLLHDIGELQLLQWHGAGYAALHARQLGADEMRAAEVLHFGHAHDALGAELLEGWGLPQPIADAARLHHGASPVGLATPVQQAVWVANLLAGTADEAARATAQSPATLAPVERAVERARAEIETLASLLNG